MYNGLSAGNQDLGILPPPVVAGHWGWGGERCAALGTKYFGSSETTRGNQRSTTSTYKIRYSPVKYESTYVVDINRINMNYYSSSNININCFSFF